MSRILGAIFQKVVQVALQLLQCRSLTEQVFYRGVSFYLGFSNSHENRATGMGVQNLSQTVYSLGHMLHPASRVGERHQKALAAQTELDSEKW